MGKPGALIAAILLGVLAACATAALSALPATGQAAAVTLVGAGDISSCSHTNDTATARLLGRTPGTVFTLGDNVDPRGTAQNYRNCYRPTWGRYKKRTMPAVGNHDYDGTVHAGPYFDYFGARAGRIRQGYYSYNRGAWHIVVLNSNCDRIGGCGRNSAQGRWLRSDLARSDNRCTLAYFHHPLYASGSGTATAQVKPFWNMLQARRADVIMSGHAHRYERYAPMTPAGRRAANGIRQFVVGTGGESGGSEIHREDAPNMQVVKTDVSGVLRLSLRPTSYSWRFVRAAGASFTDSGTGRCH
jgi:acid phosphatase type 7